MIVVLTVLIALTNFKYPVCFEINFLYVERPLRTINNRSPRVEKHRASEESVGGQSIGFRGMI